MSKNKQINPDHYQVISCTECDSTEGLEEDKFNFRVVCTCCLAVIRAERAIENEKEDYYTDQTYNELVQERNA